MSEEKSQRPLANRGFLSLIFTQFFGAANDYLLKTVLTYGLAAAGIWKSALGEGGHVYPAYCLVVPFFLFCVIAGQVADRYSKREVAIWVKKAEVVFALLALIGFWLGNFWFCLLAMMLLGIQSAFFNPVKYGLIPELVETKQLSRANGLINMLTNLAAIIASVFGGVLYVLYRGDNKDVTSPEGMLWLPGGVMVLVSVLGLVAVHQMPKLKAASPEGKIRFNPFTPFFSTLTEMKRSGTPILIIAILWSIFYLIAYTVMLILPDYTNVLNIEEDKLGYYLLGPLGISIGIGCAFAGWVSGDRIQPRFVPIGAIGLTVCFFLLGTAPAEVWIVTAYTVLAGLFAGIYIVPLQALLQKLAPKESRGRIIGTAGALSAVFEVVGIGIFQASKQMFNMDSQQVFLILSGVGLLATLVFYWKVRSQINRPEWC